MASLTVLQGACTIQLSRGLKSLIDAADYAWASQRKWFASGKSHVYACCYLESHYQAGKRLCKQAKMHRELAGNPDGLVDHRNGDPLDNRRSNLRICGYAENAQNIRRSHGRSRFKGVSFLPVQNRWTATITRDGKSRILGSFFRTEEEAARAYDLAAVESFGEFACTNQDLYGEYWEVSA